MDGASPAPLRASRPVRLLIAFLVALLAYAAAFTYRPVTDTDLNGLQTRALVLHGDLDLSRYEPTGGFTREVDDATYSIYGAGISIMSAPAYAVLARADVSEAHRQAAAVLPFLAGALVLMFLVLERLSSAPLAAAGAVLLGFGTTMWPVAGTALWQHGPVVFLQCAGLLALFGSGRHRASWAGLALGAAVFVRLASAPVAIAVAVFQLSRGRDQFLRYAAGIAIPAVAVLVQNEFLWGGWLTTSYAEESVGFGTPIGEGLAGSLLGTRKGLFVYSPVLLLAPVGMVLAARSWRTERGRALLALSASSVAMIALYAMRDEWWGGDGQFGYRYLIDTVPALMVLAVVAVASLPRLRVPAAILALVSIGTMIAGALPGPRAWDGGSFPSSLADSPIVRAWSSVLGDPLPGVIRALLVASVGIALLASASARWPAGGATGRSGGC